MKTLAQVKKKLLRNTEISREYMKLAPEYDLISEVIKKRLQRKMTQHDLARKAGTQQSAISRLESGNSNPSFQFLSKVASALGTTLTISLHDRRSV